MKKINLTEKEKKIVYGVIILLIVILGLYGYKCVTEKVCKVEIIDKIVRHEVAVIMPNGALVAEVVDTDSSRALGLSGRTAIRDNEGMLFIFDVPGRYGFWMKDMLFPIDIVWINQNGVVVYIEHNLTKESYPKTFMNGPEANFVLEMNAGRAEQYGLFLGSKIKIEE